MAQTWQVYDTESGRVVSTINRVADGVKLTACAADNASSSVTTAATAGLLPGMLLKAKGIPEGTTVLTVDTATTFTLSANTTAALAGAVIHALSYIPYNAAGELVAKEVHLEHFRDLFEDAAEFDIRGTIPAQQGDPVPVHDKRSMKGVLYPGEEIELKAVSIPLAEGQVGVSTLYVGAFTDEPLVSVSDHISHTPPREQTQKCSYVHFVLVDGNLLPVLRKPSFDIVPVS